MSYVSAMARLADPDDARAIARVHVRSWQAVYRGVIAEEFLGSLDVDRRTEMINRMIRDESRVLLVCERDERVAGYSMLGPSDDEGWGEVLAIYASPDRWGVGVGHELMTASEQWFHDQGYRRAMLWVLENNPRARAFYEREGWGLGKRFRIENIGGTDVTEVRYERDPLTAP